MRAPLEVAPFAALLLMLKLAFLCSNLSPPRSQAHMKHLNNLRKLAANKSCATCTYEDKMVFKDVCM